MVRPSAVKQIVKFLVLDSIAFMLFGFAILCVGVFVPGLNAAVVTSLVAFVSGLTIAFLGFGFYNLQRWT